MNVELFQAMLDIVFKGHLLYLAPILFIIMASLFADRIIEVTTTAMAGSQRRSRY